MKNRLLCSILLLLIFNVLISKSQDITGYERRDPIYNEITPDAVEARINEIRKGELTIKAKPGADITIQQVRHEFLFGTAVANQVVKGDSFFMSNEDKKMYIKTLSENFNYAVHENALKWYDCEKKQGVVDYSIADKIWQLCDSLHIPMRGHCIYWEKEEFVQPWLKALNNDELRMAVNRRGIDVATHFKGKITEYDLNNEMIHGDFFRRRLGYGVMNEMAYIVKSVNPDAQLYVNDYGILVDGGFNLNAYIMQIDNLLKSGVPINGIGCQAHPGTRLRNPMSPYIVQRGLNKLSKFNLPVKITEAFFAGGLSDSTMEKEMKEILPVYFAHPKVEAIVFWGFWEGAHWQPRSALWEKDWTLTLQGQAYRDFVFKKWWTQTEGKAGKDGTFKTRAFYGDYIITVNGKQKKIFFSKKDKNLEVTF